MDYWQGQDATRAPELDYWTLSIQRQLSSSTVLEADYNATVGTHLQAGLVNINQVPMSVVNELIPKYGATQAHHPAELQYHFGCRGRRGYSDPVRELHEPRCSGR